MRVDARVDRSWHGVGADVCVIGCGPAGLAVASRLADGGRSVLVLESGGNDGEPFYDALNAGEDSGGYGEIASTRCRRVGGTVNVWNTEIAGHPAAKFVPLDAVDLRPRPGRRAHWPLTYDELEPAYEQAQALAGLGPFRYEGDAWREPGRPAWESDRLTTRVYQFGSARRYTEVLADRLCRSSSLLLVTHATVVALSTNAAGNRVTAARVALPGAPSVPVRARRFVLAAGAIESARLLLASDAVRAEGVGNRSGLVGRGLMEHPRDYALTLHAKPGLAEELGFYDVHQSQDGTWIQGRLALRSGVLAAQRLPNASATLLAAYRTGVAARLLDRGRRLMGRPARYPRGGTGWSSGRGSPERFRVLLNLEQMPDAGNRIELSDVADALGMRQARLCWRWSPDEQVGLDRLRCLIRDELAGMGWGDVEVDPNARPDPRAHHHAGTLRMHEDPGHGVVDAHGRAHDVENLYCAGAAVFPTAGFANPMLTILATSIRLAEHLS